MPVDYYPQKTIAELLVMLDSVQKRMTGGALSMTTAAGVQNMRSWQGAREPQIENLNLQFSLYRKDPVQYRDPFRQRVTRQGTTYA